MTMRQLHYTSCRDGRDGIDGFQVAAATPGLPARHEQLGLPLAAYRPPPSAPLVPDATELAGFPVAFGYARFDDVAVLFRSVYLGTDFTGRQGNYFAHLLVLDQPAAELAGRSPAEAWDAAEWTATRASGTDLPILPAIPVGPLADPAELHQRLVPLRAALGELVDAVVDVLGGHARRVVVVADRPADVAALVAGICRSLPPGLAEQVSFTTYTATPGSAGTMIAGTTPDVTLPRDTDVRVVRLATPVGTGGSAFADLVAAAWVAGSPAVGVIARAAADIRPALRLDELDAFASLARIAQPGAAPDPQTTVTGLLWAIDRAPGSVTPAVWERASQVAVPIGDVARWAAVLQHPGGRGAAPALVERYAQATLAAVAAGGMAVADVWLPPVPQLAFWVVHWLGGTVAEHPTVEAVGRGLALADRFRVPVPDTTLRELADLVVVPLIVGSDDATASADDELAALAALPGAPQLTGFAAELLESRLDDADLFDAAIAGMPARAAEALLTAAAGRPRCTAVAELALARAGHRDRVRTVVRHTAPADPTSLRRNAALLWPQPPPLADGLLLCRSFEPSVLGRSGLALRILNRIVADAGSGSLGLDAAAVAAELATPPFSGVLPPEVTPTLDAVARGTAFCPGPAPSREAEEEATATVLLADRGEPAVGQWAADAVAAWLLAQHTPLFHIPVLTRLLATGARRFATGYRRRLGAVLAEADPSAVAALLPVIATVAAAAPANRDLLDQVGQDALRGRRGRELDQVRKELQRRGHRGLAPPAGAADWPAWWDGWRAAALSGSGKAGLRGLLGRFGPSGGGSDD